LFQVTIESKLTFNLSLIAHKSGNLDESMLHCNKAIVLNSTYLKAIIHRAKLHQLKELYEDSVRDYEVIINNVTSVH